MEYILDIKENTKHTFIFKITAKRRSRQNFFYENVRLNLTAKFNSYSEKYYLFSEDIRLYFIIQNRKFSPFTK